MRLNDVLLNDSRITIFSCVLCKIIAFNYYSSTQDNLKKEEDVTYA